MGASETRILWSLTAPTRQRGDGSPSITRYGQVAVDERERDQKKASYQERGLDWFVSRHRSGVLNPVLNLLVIAVRLPGVAIARITGFLWQRGPGDVVERAVLSLILATC